MIGEIDNWRNRRLCQFVVSAFADSVDQTCFQTVCAVPPEVERLSRVDLECCLATEGNPALCILVIKKVAAAVHYFAILWGKSRRSNDVYVIKVFCERHRGGNVNGGRCMHCMSFNRLENC